MQPIKSWSKQTKIIVGSITAVSILALALGLGLGLGLRKTEALPAAVDPNFLPSNKCPVFTAFDGKGEVTIEGVLRVNVQEGIDGKSAVTSFVLEYGSEKIAILVDPATEKWLSKMPNAVVRVTGTKTDCSLRVGYNANNNPDEPKTNTNINVVTSTTTNVVRPTNTVDPPKPTNTNEPPKPTTTNEEPPKTTSTSTSTTNTPTPTPPVVKNLKIAIVLFGFSNDPAPSTESGEQFMTKLFQGNGPNGMTQFFEKYFYGNIKFQALKDASKQADVFGWQTLSARNDDNCNFFDWTTEADKLSGISEMSGYDHIIHIVNRAPKCDFGGLANVPGWWSLTRNDWSADTKAILYHELGHNLGFNHAGSCFGISGSKVSVTDANLGSCSFSEYGDLLDIMGVPARNEDSDYQGWRFETNRRNAVGALPSVNRINLSGGSGGVYALSNSENFDLSGNKIVSICYPMKKKRVVGSYEFDNYCLELQGSANNNMKTYVDGKTPAVTVRMTQSLFARSMLLQVFMGEAGDYFEDADNAFKVTVVAISSNLASVKIDL